MSYCSHDKLYNCQKKKDFSVEEKEEREKEETEMEMETSTLVKFACILINCSLKLP